MPNHDAASVRTVAEIRRKRAECEKITDGRYGDVTLRLADIDTLLHVLDRAAYLVENLASQVPEFTGVVGPGGESEDEHIRGQLYNEAASWR